MANNRIQVKRTSVSGRTANVTNVTNSQYIAAGELALNMPDGILYSSNGSALITVGSNLVNQRITNSFTIDSNKPIRFQTVNTSAVAYFIQQNDDNFVFYTTNTSYGARPVYSIFANSDNSELSFSVPVRFNGNVTALTANGTTGTAGQVLTSNGTATYWASVGGTGTVTSVATGNGMTGGPITTTGTVSVLANTGIVANSTGLFVNSVYIGTLTANNTNFVGTVSAANVVSNAQLSANLANYQTTAGLASNVAVLAANSATYLGGNTASDLRTYSDQKAGNAYTNAVSYVDGKSFVNTSQLSTNLANYQTTAGLASNVATLTANNTSFVGTVSAANVVSNAQLSGNLANYVTTTNLTNNLANYQTTAGLAANVATLTANNTSFVGTVSAANVVSNAQLSANLANYQTTAGLASNVATLTANNANYVKANNGITSNSSGVFVTQGTGTVVNATGVHVNATYIGTLSANNTTYVNGKTEGNLNVNSATTALTANNSTNLGGVAAASYQLNSTLAANVATLTANNTSFVGAVSAANVVSNAQLSGNLANYVTSTNLTNNLANYQTTAGLSANVATLTANNTSFVGTVSAANVVSNAQLSGNLANYQTTAGLSANVATLTANNANNLNGQPASFYTNATNITSGTLPYAQIPANVINTTAAFTISGVHTYNANVILGSSGLSANASFGTAGQVLHSNGTATYWATDDQGVTSVATGNGLTGGTITTTGTVSVLANTGIVANATGVYVNATYIGTLSANNTTYVNGKTEGNLNVNSAVYSTNAINANNADYLDGQHGSYYAANSLLANYALLSGASFTGNVTANNANTTFDLNVGRNLTVAGNLTITGNVTVVGANTLEIVDNFIYLNSNNSTQNEDIGVAGNYNDGTYAHTGIFRDATDGYWKVFDGYTPEPDAAVNIDTSNASFNIAGFWTNNVRLGNSTVYGTINSTSYSGTANNTNFVGTVSAANVVSNAQLSGNLASYVTTTALTNNLANYQTTAGLSANVATLTANNANFVKANNGITSNSSGVFVTQGTGTVVNATGVHVNATYIGTLTANNANYFGGALSNTFIKNNSLVQYFNAFVPSNTVNKYYSSITTNRFLGRASQLYVTVDGTPNSSIASVISDGGFESIYAMGTAGGANVVVNINFVTNGLTGATGFTYSSGEIGVYFYPGRHPSALTARYKDKDGIWTTATVSNNVYYTTDTIGFKLTNLPGNYVTDVEITMTPNPTLSLGLTEIEYHGSRMGLSEGPFVTVGGATFYGNIIQNANLTISNTGNLIFTPNAGIIANNGYGAAGQVLHSNGSAVYWAADDQGVTSVATGNGLTGGTITTTGTVSVLANTGIVANATGVYVNATYIGTLTANNTSFVGTVSAANVVSNAQLSGNLANYVTTTNLTNNLANYQTTAGLASNVATLTANNADYLDGQHGAYYTNATNITTGTLPYAQIPANIINTTSAFTVTGVHTYNANVVLGAGLSANGGFGAAGQVLHSNGTATYWDADDQGVTSVATGNGLTGGTITATGTVSVLANTGIVANATGVYVNATYIGTLSANNTTYVNGKTEGNLNVNSATTALTANNATNLGGVAAANYARVDTADSFDGVITFNANVVMTKALSANGGFGTAGQVLTSGAAGNVYWATPTVGDITAVTAGNGLTGGGTSGDVTLTVGAANGITVSATAVGVTQGTGTVVNATGVHVNATYIGTLSANNTTYLNNKTESNLNVNTALTANNTTYLNNQLASYYTNATNITTGTLPYAQIPANVINTTSAFTVTGVHTYNANVILGAGLSANGGFGTAGHVLHSNGTATYWAPDENSGGTVTSVATGNGLTGGAITTTGTVSILANTGIVANATGAYVNATYIGTLTANNTSFVGTVSAANVVSNAQLSANLANYVTTTNLTNNLANYQTTAGLASNVATLSANNATYLNGQLAAYYTNATNITTGTLPYAQIPANVINTTAAFTRTGITTFNANVVLGAGLSANGGFGAAGEVLHSNGTATYWATQYGFLDVTSAAGTTTLTSSSPRYIRVTGSLTQTIVLPDVSTLPLGTAFLIHNLSSGQVTIQSSGLNQIVAPVQNHAYEVRSIATTGTGASVWQSRADGSTAITGTGNIIGGFRPTLQQLQMTSSTSFTAGTDAQGQGALSENVTVITTTATNPSGVTLPSAGGFGTSQSRLLVVINKGTNPVKVYPVSGGQIDALGTNVAISLPVGGMMTFYNASTTQWYSSINNVSNFSGTVTSVATGNGLTGGTITTTGTVSILANTGIVANATGVYVNSAYIATIASNSATYANSSISNTFTVGTASYFVANGNLGVGTASPGYKLQVNGSFAATTKSFVIDHPTEPDMKLRYGSLEGPENGVYVRGKLEGKSIIELPDYWCNLIDESTITVNLTPIGRSQDIWVQSTSAYFIHLNQPADCFFTVFAERKDVDKLVVEF